MRSTDVLEELNKPASIELMNSNIPARLAYVARVIPMAFHWTGEKIVMATTTNAPKLKGLKANPSVALSIDTNAFPPKILLIRGPVEVETVQGIPEEYIEASRKHVPAETFDQWLAGVRGMYKEMAKITLTPAWVKLIDFENTLPSNVEELIQKHGQH